VANNWSVRAAMSSEARLEMAIRKWPEFRLCELVNAVLDANLLAMPLNLMT
jgi:hypothetical protein